jgi:hypothetical protein
MGGFEAASTSFIDLRRLADWFDSLSAHRTAAPSIERVVRRLGGVCIPLLGRELVSTDARRRDAARAALAQVARDARARVIALLREIAASTTACDDGKVAAVGLLSELGERSSAKFTDPSAIQRRSALALATELDNPADVAAAADMMIQQLDDDEIVQLIEVMVAASQGAAYHLAVELCARLDVDADTRERIAHIALGNQVPLPVHDRRAPRPLHTAVLVDTSGRAVVVACRKLAGERRWRRWAVLIDARGGINDCVHEDRAAHDADHAPLIASLVADGYHLVTTDVERARGLVAAAARQSATASEAPDRLPTAYYLGRDLLDLGEAHLGGRVHAHPTSTTLGRAVELIADNELPRAQVLLARCPESADALAATAACLLSQQRAADALAPLTRAIELEPDFPLHHWNHAALLHQLGDARGCYAALRRFLSTSERPTGLFADPDQPSRVALASRMISDLERNARLTGTPLVTPPRRKKKRSAAKR